MKVVAVVVARNEEKIIGDTIQSIINQTIPVDIVVVDDGSTDKTGCISRKMGCDVVSLPYHEKSYVGKPELAAIVNAGLVYAKKLNPDWILQMGGDHILDSDYVEKLINKMGNTVKVASGNIGGLHDNIPCGSGRLVDAKFWLSINGMLYPVSPGWEPWLVYKAFSIGYKARCYSDVGSTTRPVGMSLNKAFNWGRADYALGKPMLFSLGRSCIFIFRRKSILIGISMFLGFLKAWVWREEKLDVTPYVRSEAFKTIKKLLRIYG